MADKQEVRVSVKHGQHTMEISLPSSSRVKDLMDRLQSLTNVLPRGQKLIFKGKILTSDMLLKEANVINGSKLMMMATQGAHQGPVQHVQKPVMNPSRQDIRKNDNPPERNRVKDKPPEKSRMDTWKATGIVSFFRSEISEIPADVWSLGASVRVLDLSFAKLNSLPPEITSLSNLQRLNLTQNSIKDEGVPWKVICSLTTLHYLTMDFNCLTYLPMEIEQLTNLRYLFISNNKLTSLPQEIGKLSKLERLNVSNNRLREIPLSIGFATSLLEVYISNNYLTSIPSSFGNLRQLKVLNLKNNALSGFPPEVLKGCVELITLYLHGNEIAMESLREVDGWKEFDARRKSKYDKQIDFQIMGDGFDEGADTEHTRHW